MLRECILQEAKLRRNAFRTTQTKEILHTTHCSRITNERLFFRLWENGCRWESRIKGWTQWKCRAVGPMEVHITAHNFNNLCRSLGQQRMVRMPYKWPQNCHSSLWAKLWHYRSRLLVSRKGNGSCKRPMKGSLSQNRLSQLPSFQKQTPTNKKRMWRDPQTRPLHKGQFQEDWWCMGKK